MIWVFAVCFLLTVVFLLNFRRRMKQGEFDLAGLNLLGGFSTTIAGIIIVQFI